MIAARFRDIISVGHCRQVKWSMIFLCRCDCRVMVHRRYHPNFMYAKRQVPVYVGSLPLFLFFYGMSPSFIRDTKVLFFKRERAVGTLQKLAVVLLAVIRKPDRFILDTCLHMYGTSPEAIQIRQGAFHIFQIRLDALILMFEYEFTGPQIVSILHD